MRVTDGGHRVPLGEQPAQQYQLGVAGVLVLVEEHHGEPGALPDPDVPDLGGEPGRERYLVTEVEYLALALAPQVGLDQRDEDPPGGEPGEPLTHGAGRTARLLAPGFGGQPLCPGDDPLEEVGHVAGHDQVLGALAGEREHRLGHRGRSGVHLAHVPVPALHHLVGQLPAAGLGEQPGPGLDADAQPVVAQHRGRVGVVRRDGHRLRLVPVQTPPVQCAQAGAHPVGEFTRGLAGERQPEDLLGSNDPVGHQPDHAGGHGLGLARAGTGHHE